MCVSIDIAWRDFTSVDMTDKPKHIKLLHIFQQLIELYTTRIARGTINNSNNNILSTHEQKLEDSLGINISFVR